MANPIVQAKPFYKSKVLWTNATALVTAAGLVVMGDADWQAALLPVILAIANMGLRIVTKQPLE